MVLLKLSFLILVIAILGLLTSHQYVQHAHSNKSTPNNKHTLKQLTSKPKVVTGPVHGPEIKEVTKITTPTSPHLASFSAPRTPFPFPPGGKRKLPANDSQFTTFIHHVHIPKCGGTSYSSVLRRAGCEVSTRRLPSLDPSTIDCCVNPGKCDARGHKTCAFLMSGCHNHIPQLNEVKVAQHKFTIIRDPTSRVKSAFYYRCHSPNQDCYHVREEYCQLKFHNAGECGKEGTPGRVWSFDEYLELPEYHNIYTRMFGTGSRTGGIGQFAYTADSEVGEEEFEEAKAILGEFDLVGLQEMYDISVAMTLDILEVEMDVSVDLVQERSKGKSEERIALDERISGDEALAAKIREVEKWDILLFGWAKEQFCAMVEERGEGVLEKVEEGKVETYRQLCEVV